MSASTGSSKQVVPRPSIRGIPTEIRYMMFEDLLLVANVRTQTINPKFDDKPFFDPLNVDHETPGIVQGLSPWNVKYGLETEILSVEELQKDAHAVFEKNNWVHITVNVGDFSAQLREAGFEVLTAARAQNIKAPAFEIKISFDVTSRGEDKFFWPSLDLPWLCHALSLTSHYDTAKLQLTICARPGDEAKATTATHQEAREWELIGPFTETIVKPRSVEFIGSKSVKVAKWLQNFDGTTHESDEVLTNMVNDKLNESNTAVQAECWQEAHDKALSCLGLIDIISKCDAARRRYADIVVDFLCIQPQCTSNMTLARLKLGDAEGAFKKSQQTVVSMLPQTCLFDTYLRQAMAAAASNHFHDARYHFIAAKMMSPSHPQLREELEAFKARLIRETGTEQDIEPDTRITSAIILDLTNVLRF